MYNSSNPFMDMFKAFNDNNFNNYSKTLLQSMDVSNMMAICRRNTETMIEASKMVSENTQATMRRQAEIMQNEYSNIVQLSKDSISSSNPELNANRSSNYTKNLFENMVENTKEMADKMTKSNMELYSLLTDKMSENLNDYCNTASNVAQNVNNTKKKAAA